MADGVLHVLLASRARVASGPPTFHYALVVSPTSPPPPTNHRFQIYQINNPDSPTEWFTHHETYPSLTAFPNIVGLVNMGTVSGLSAPEVEEWIRSWGAEARAGDWRRDSWSCAAWVLRIVDELRHSIEPPLPVEVDCERMYAVLWRIANGMQEGRIGDAGTAKATGSGNGSGNGLRVVRFLDFLENWCVLLVFSASHFPEPPQLTTTSYADWVRER